jgi:hypothetical protein
MGQRCRRCEETADLLGTEDGGQAAFGCSAKKGQGLPVALQAMLGEKPDATVADAHGVGARWSTFFRGKKYF